MTECTPVKIEFPPSKRRKIEVEFAGGDITSDGGVLLLRQMDDQLNLLKSVNQIIPDPRDPRYIIHDQLSMLRQRVYGLCLGYEDLNDHDLLRVDPALQTAVNRDQDLASDSTLSRLENRMNQQVMWDIHEVLVNQFIQSFDQPPTELLLDMDATDDEIHGHQEGRFFHGYYDHYCFMPLYIFCDKQFLVSYLRPSNIDGAKHAWGILSLLVKKLRGTWPDVSITIRGDSGFCRDKMLRWCDKNDINYIVGIAKNNRLIKSIKSEMQEAELAFESTKTASRVFKSFQYQAKKWKAPRRVIGKAEHLFKGANPRFIVTNIPEEAQLLYEQVYCARGEMENRIKEQQLDLFADRTSSHYWWSNQFRLLLSSLAYVLLDSIRRIGLKDTEHERLQVGSIRLRFLKIGAVIIRNTRRIRFLLSSSYPYKSSFERLANKLQACPG